MRQMIIQDYDGLDRWIHNDHINKILLVCGRSIRFQDKLNEHLDLISKAGTEIIKFQDFLPNPLYESVLKGVEIFRSEQCDAIMAVGGGSAIDVAKCIKLYSNMNGNGSDGDFLKQDIIPNEIPFMAIPTTAGTGSEATRFAVIYYRGEKHSVADHSAIPQAVLLDAGTLNSLPDYQRKSSMFDALCHAMESFWSLNSTELSMKYSWQSIRMIIDNLDGYLKNTESGNLAMLTAANIAGKAINITETTAGHAMCYKITSLYNCAHGHAAILCDKVLFPWTMNHLDKCIDSRGKQHLESVFQQIADAMRCRTAQNAANKLNEIFYASGLEIPKAAGSDYNILINSVNQDRLKNHPVSLSKEDINILYHSILK